MLHVDVSGDGPDLVLVHGWGMHGGIWSEWAKQLGKSFRVHCVDLPGHGNSAYTGQSALHEWAGAVLDTVPEQAWWLGWSLGGLISLAAARRQENTVRGVLLLATTPKFVASDGWKPAVDKVVFDQFAHQLEADAARTLVRFLSLQARSADRSGETLRRLRAVLKKRPYPHTDALRAGLQFLQQADMREVMQNPGVPLFWLLGERDTLVPSQVARQFPDVRTAVVEGAGHAPFLSHPLECGKHVKHWLLDGDKAHYAAG